MHAPTRSSAAIARTAVLSLLAACSLTCSTLGQVRMNLRTTMQIDGMGEPPFRFWPREVNAFTSGDVDGDGDLDLLAAMQNGGGLLWLNDGQGAFPHTIGLAAANQCLSCALFDADGDGDLDALLGAGGSSNSYAGLTHLHRNDGAGTFTPMATVPGHPVNDVLEVDSIGIGDLDGDGDNDVMLSVWFPGGVRLWRNEGSCVFTDQTTTAWLTGLTGLSSGGALADVEPDGDIDIVNWQHLYRNDGLGTFTTEPPIPWPMPSWHRALTDVDGDGLVDEVGVDLNTNVPFVRRNVGGGVFQNVSTTWFEPHALVNHSFGSVSRVCTVFDADGDGDPDLVTGGSEYHGSSNTVGVPPTLFLNSNRQRFVDAGRPPLPMLQTLALGFASGDLDGDGHPDLVISHGSLWGASSTVWLQDAAGRFDETASLAGPGSYVPKLGDVDGDGDLDLVAVHSAGRAWPGLVGQHRLHLNDGAGNFTDVTSTHMPITAVSGGASAAIGDVDGDGDADVVIASYDPNYGGPGVPLMLLRNNGAGVFANASASMPATPYEATYTELRDFDGDGDRDVVVASDRERQPIGWPSLTHPILFFANDGTGTFTDETSTRMPSTAWTWGLSVLDLDHDGDLDVAQAHLSLLNNGTGVFTAAGAGERVLVADFDEDGVADQLRDHLGTGSSPSSLEVIGGPVLFRDVGSLGRILLPTDLDRDGDLDLVMGPAKQGISVWDNLRIEVIYNLRRDLRVATLPRIGADYTVQLRATNGNAATLAVVAVATATLPQAIMIPGWGLLQLDPSQMSVFATALIPDADTMVEVSMAIPNAPTLFGLPLSCQALFIPIGNEAATHLSNTMTFPLER